MVAPDKNFTPRDLGNFCARVLMGAGMSAGDASIVSESLVAADTRGVYSHGVVRLETYLNKVEAGAMNISAPITVVRDEGATALIDAGNAFGQVASHRAMTIALDKAGRYGVGAVGVRNSNHFGIGAYFAMMALKMDMVGFVITSASPAMAAYGTKPPLLGTNPLAVAIPAGSRDPVVLDMSTSLVARGKIRYAALTGKDIPLGWARDVEGRPTQDAKAALKGTLEPIGGAKGAGLSLVIDLLCGVMTDTVLTGGVLDSTDLSGPTGAGHFFAALNPARFIDPARFKAHMDEVIGRIKSLPAVEAGEVYLPGEIEFNTERRMLADGIALAAEVVASLNKLAARYGVDPLG